MSLAVNQSGPSGCLEQVHPRQCQAYGRLDLSLGLRGCIETTFREWSMSSGVRRKAFDPFFTTRRDQGSTGLGLHIVYSIVTNYLGGRLNLDSKPGADKNPDRLAARGTGSVPSQKPKMGERVSRASMRSRSVIASSLRM